MEIYKEWKDSYEVFLHNNSDHRTRDWFLLNSDPRPVWIITAAYLVFVWLGPKLMRKREAFSLTSFMLVYNLALVALSLYMFIEIFLSIVDAKYNFFCATYNEETKKDPRELRVANVLYWYFFSKVVELIDTVLMIIKKNNRQVTFLHVFHHAVMVNIWWWVMMFIPGGLSWFGAWLNCLVHVAMYSYYGLAAIPALRGKLWWKAYITRFQLIQFVITLSHTLISLNQDDCDFPHWGQYLLGGLMVTMLILFGNFYIHAYIYRKHTHKSHIKDTHVSNGNGVSVTNGDARRRSKKTE